MDNTAMPGQHTPKPTGVGQEPVPPEPSTAESDAPSPPASGDANCDTTAEWTMLSEAMADYDEDMIQRWKDDLSNLLVFVSLFSGVVAGFSLESFGWLQQDTSSQDTVVQLLAQISSQLASFSVSQGFINSTIEPIPLTSLDAPSGPSELDVRINILWFLSLAMSLVASLFAIMVQQWLREYRVPGHLSIRERVRLRQYRFDALQLWCVPEIVSVLPLLLQVALVLFLVGLCYLLASLDKTVAKAFIASVGIALSTYFAFTVLPIISRRCPYKNSFAHGSVLMVKFVLLFVLVYVFIVAISFVVFLTILHFLCMMLFGVKESRLLVILNKGALATASFAPKLFDSHTAQGGHEYWTARELDVLPKSKHLEQNALIWAPSGLSNVDLARVDRCLHELPTVDRMRCICIWVSQALNVSSYSIGRATQGCGSAFDSASLATIDQTFSDRFRHSFLAAMPSVVVGKQDHVDFYESSVLTVLRYIARLRLADADWTITYARRLLDIRGAQTPQNIGRPGTPWTRLPTACLFELSTLVWYEFNIDDVSALFDYAIQNYEILCGEEMDLVVFIACLDMMLGSYATALHALSRQPALLETQKIRPKCRMLLEILNHTVVEFADHIARQGTYDSEYLEDNISLVTVPACNSLCKSIISLVRVGGLPCGGSLTLSTLLDNLVETFKGPAFEEGRTAILEFKASQDETSPLSVVVLRAADSGSVMDDKHSMPREIKNEDEIPDGTVVPVVVDTIVLQKSDSEYEGKIVNAGVTRPVVDSSTNSSTDIIEEVDVNFVPSVTPSSHVGN